MEPAKTETANKGIRPSLLLTIGAIVVALLAAKLSGVLGGNKPAVIASEGAPVEVAPSESPTTRSPSAMTPSRPRPIAPAQGAPATTPLPESVAVTPPPDAAPDWSAKLDEVLGSTEAEPLKADRLLAMWPGLPAEAQVEMMQHIANLLPDDKFNRLHNTFTNAQTHEEVLDVIMTDALNRPNGVKLPALLDVARTPGHPKAEEARDILEVFVDENHGADWAKWEKAVQDWLKANPDEAPEDVGTTDK